MMTDPIADMLTRMRNAIHVERPIVDMPASRLKTAIAEALKTEGYIFDYQVGQTVLQDGHPVFQQTPPAEAAQVKKAVLRVFLKYGPNGERVIQHLERVSTPGCRVYRRYRELKPVLDGLGISLLSTSKGVLSDRQARQQKLGGEVLARVW
jgi:small subunit ribosomal protein S8